MTNATQSILIIASDNELMAADRVWGHGGWLEPQQREALDWLTLVRLLGWDVRVSHLNTPGLMAPGPHPVLGIVVACDPDALSTELVGQLETCLARDPILIIARAAPAGSPLSRLAGVESSGRRIVGQSLTWAGPAPSCFWKCRSSLQATELQLAADTSVWATLAGQPVIAARRVGAGTLATIGFHPSEARDAAGTGTALLRQLLICGSQVSVAWLEWDQTLVLRMDDPGGAQNVHSRQWCYRKLGETDWTEIGTDLKQRDGRLSLGYVAGWVDDGDATRGKLEVAGQSPQRIPGAVYPSPLVKYLDCAGHAPGRLNDYAAEFRGIQSLRAAALADVEMHGFTHMHPDSGAWAQASDRYESLPDTAWFRELGMAARDAIAARPPDQHPLALGIAALDRDFQTHPTTLICPGEQWTNEVLQKALDLGLQLVSSYYLALRHEDRFCWSQHVCAPYLDKPDAAWFDSGLPVVGYCHDYELATEGVAWMTRWLDAWQSAGARRFIDFRELAAAVGRRLTLEDRGGQLHLTVASHGAPPLVRPLLVIIRSPDGHLPIQISVSHGTQDFSLPVEVVRDGLGRVMIPI